MAAGGPEGRTPAEMAATMRRMSWVLLAGAVVLAVAGLVVLVTRDRNLLGWLLVAVAVVDCFLAAGVRRAARPTHPSTREL